MLAPHRSRRAMTAIRSLLALAIVATIIPPNAQAQRTPEPPLARELMVELRNLLVSYPPADRNQLGTNLVQYYLNRADPDNALELAVQLDGGQGLFGSITSYHHERGGFTTAMRIASLMRDSAERSAVYQQMLYKSVRTHSWDEVDTLLEKISGSENRIQALMNISRSTYPRDTSTNRFARRAYDLAREDTSAQGRGLMTQAAWTLFDGGDLSALREMEYSIVEPRQRISHLMQIGSRLRDTDEPRADSLFDAALSLAKAYETGQPQMMSMYMSMYRAGRRDSNYMAIASGIEPRQARHSYLASAASYFGKSDPEVILRIADYLTAQNDTSRALSVLSTGVMNAANSRQFGPPASDRFLQLFERLRQIESTLPANRRQNVSASALSSLISTDFARVRRMVADSGLRILEGYARDHFLNVLSSIDVRAGLELIKTETDSTRRDRLLAAIATKQGYAGYQSEAEKIIAMISSNADRTKARLQLAQQRAQYGDTTGVRTLVREATQMIRPREFNQFGWMMPQLIMRSGLYEEYRRWAATLPDSERAFVLAPLLQYIR